MKRILFLAVAVVSLLTACSPDLHLDISKRRYRKGFHVDAGSGHRQSVTAERQVEQTAKMPVIVSALPQAQNEPLVEQHYSVPVVEAQPPVVASNETVTQVKHTRSTPAAVDAISTLFAKEQSVQSASKFQQVKQAAKRFFHPQEDVPFWLLIVLCILLPPLAVFLKFGIGTEFWISLILTLIFWLPGVIYALIVVTR